MMNNYRFLKVLSIIFLILFVSGCQKDEITKPSLAYETTAITASDHQLQAYIAGSGDNTIVFESDLNVDGKTWFKNNIFGTFGSFNQVIAYSRAGYYISTLGNSPRNLAALVDDLDKIIIAKSSHEKVVLVGHAFGGAIIRAYALAHPNKVKSIFFINPLHENDIRCATMTQAQEDSYIQRFQTLIDAGPGAEASQLLENRAIMNNFSILPNIPVTVLTSLKLVDGITQTEVGSLNSAHQSLGEGVENFSHITTSASGSFIYEEEPKLVIDNLKLLLKK